MEQAFEVRASELPPASQQNLERLRTENCSGSSKDFRLQSFQLFLRRILSPDSPVRSMLLFHGTGVGKTCTAIQVAEEYIMKPEFQDKKVLVLASAAVQENFKTQVFDVTRVSGDKMTSQQCTGRRYLDMLERAQTEGLRWENPESREKLNTIVQSMVDDFYDFKPYQGWANTLDKKKLTLSPSDYNAWIHETYDNRLIIVDEAQNLRESDETNKAVSEALTKLVQTANGLTLVLLSATPMYDSFDEILFFFNLFLWNDRKQTASSSTKVGDIFGKEGFKTPEAETTFRGWCHDYVSFLRGENPFTFPFRLPPPTEMIALFDRTNDIKGSKITKPRKYLPLTVSYLQSPQKEVVEAIQGTLKDSTVPTIVVSPDKRPITKCFDKGTDIAKALFRYAKDVPPFLSPSNLPKYACKFATVMKCITDTSGIVFVYSNYVRGGVQQFAMALEEAGFEPAAGPRMLETTSGEYTGSSRGKYAFLTSDMKERQIEQLIRRLRRRENKNGQDIKIILGSPLISEGIDFKNVRQIHILDPWYNMSRLEQIIGRGLRTCSHAGLDFEDQNCTVYLHTTRYADSTQETYDEYMYRVFVEEKAAKIAQIKKVIMESAIDCSSQLATNMLPQLWKDLPITQKRSQDATDVTMALSAMSAPTFEDGTPSLVCSVFEKVHDTEYVRPLGAYFDIRDDVFNKIVDMFEKKPIWSTKDLLKSPNLKYAPEVVQYLLEDAVHTHLKIKDKNGRIGVLENREGMYAFSPNDMPNGTMVERSTEIPQNLKTTIEIPSEEEKPAPLPAPKKVVEETFPFDVSEFSDEVKEWYSVDHRLKPEEKVAKIQALYAKEETNIPVWARDLKAGNMLAVSPTQIYDSENNLVEPVGTDLDALKLWTNRHIDKIAEEIKTHNKVMCTLEEGVLKFAAFEVVDDHVARIKRTKTIAPKACPFFKQTDLSAMVKDCIGHGFPAGIRTKDVQCVYLALAIRKAVLAGSPYVFWVSPEVWSFVSKQSASVRAKIV
jgi:hypothetical protein